MRREDRQNYFPLSIYSSKVTRNHQVFNYDLKTGRQKFQGGSGLNVSSTPIMAMGCRQCLPLSVVLLKGKHCKKPRCNGVVDTLRPCHMTLFYTLFLTKRPRSDTAKISQ